MENEHLLDISTDNIPLTSSPKDQSPASFSRDLIGRLGISSQGIETVIPETQRTFKKESHQKASKNPICH